jgi:hypothetical protein
MPRIPFMVRAAATASLIAGCLGCSPTEPSGASDGVTIYQHPNYGGDSRRVAADERDLKDTVGSLAAPGMIAFLQSGFPKDGKPSSTRTRITAEGRPRLRPTSLIWIA